MPATPRHKTANRPVFWWLALLGMALVIYFNQYRTLPAIEQPVVAGGFVTARAMQHVQQLSAAPRTSGSNAWQQAREYLDKQLRALGFQTRQQSTLISDPRGLRAQRIHNLVARLPATGASGHALLLMAHYDSVPRSPGAGDDASGAAVILEALRAWLAETPRPKRDIIVLITDGEENGLLGARAFVRHHPWLRDIGLVINLEARGSGGPAYLLLETRHGNRQLVQHAARIGLPRPNTSSLAYSVYRWLPNDTDLSVFHDGTANVPGYNIAFIGDPFDYHTPLDRADRLDINSLAHQGEYLLPMLRYFAGLKTLTVEADDDQLFFSVPLWQGLVQISPQAAMAGVVGIIVASLVVLILGIRRQQLSLRGIWHASLPLVQSLVLSIILSRFGWQLVVWLNPHFADMSLGFPYSGLWWMGCFLAMNGGISLWLWWRWLHQSGHCPHPLACALASALLAWLLIGSLLIMALPGAVFLWVVPASLLGLLALELYNRLSVWTWALLTAATSLLLAPVLWQLPVALGLPTLFVVAAVLALVLPVFLPPLARLPVHQGKALLTGLAVLTGGLFLLAQWHASISPDQPRQNSLLYLQDNDNRQAWWLSFDTTSDSWKRRIMGSATDQNGPFTRIDARLGPWLQQAAAAEYAAVPGFTIQHLKKTTTGVNRHHWQLTLVPQRPMQRLDLVTGVDMRLHALKLNGTDFGITADGIQRTAHQSVLRYWLQNNEPVQLVLDFETETPPYFLLYGLSGDLLDNPYLSVPPRPATMTSRPSQFTDSLLTRQTLR